MLEHVKSEVYVVWGTSKFTWYEVDSGRNAKVPQRTFGYELVGGDSPNPTPNVDNLMGLTHSVWKYLYLHGMKQILAKVPKFLS